jgi:menaquinone-specific isochorismate synthase
VRARAVEAGGPFALGERDRVALRAALARGIGRARRLGRPVLVAHTVLLGEPADPVAVAWSSRAGQEPLHTFEQPDRGGHALGALGRVAHLTASGADRFERVAEGWRVLAAEAEAEPPDGPAGSGLVALGGFAFAPEGGGAPHWQGYAPASLSVPQVVLARRGEATRMTLAAGASPDDVADELLVALERRAAGLRTTPLPLLDPAPASGSRVVSTAPPEHYEQAVARAVERIRAGELDKVVLAREVQVHGGADHDPAAIVGVLREGFPSCYVFSIAEGPSTFLAASPELLIRREGQRASTVALAGSTRRSADPAVDDHLGERLLQSAKDREEQAIVTRRIVRALRPHSVWVTEAPDPVLVKVQNIQHLATPIRAQLAAPRSAVELAGLLHPTPAVGGDPESTALPMIPALEGLDRGWYAGPIGWTDASEDGEFCVALRCALLRGPLARCYAGVGVVADSDPQAELAETEVKLQALLPVLAL